MVQEVSISLAVSASLMSVLIASRLSKDSRFGVAVLHHSIEIGRNVVLGLEIVRCVVAAEFDFHRGHSFYCAAMVLARAISRFWMLLSPPQRNSTTEGPRRIK